MTEAISIDPRPRVEACEDGRWYVAGSRCGSCRRSVAYRWPGCPACGGPLEPTRFGGMGTVWSSTVVRIPVSGRTPPYCLAYVDLDGGPRVLAHVADAVSGDPVPVGSTVCLLAPSDDGDLRVEVQR